MENHQIGAFVVFWAVAVFAACTNAADQVGSCSAVSLDGSLISETTDSLRGPSRLEDEIFRRIEQNSKRDDTGKPVFYRLSENGLVLELAGMSCNSAERYVKENILVGHLVVLAIGSDVLSLDFMTVSQMAQAPDRNLQISLTKFGRRRLRELTAKHIGAEAVMSVAEVGEVQRIPILTEITSGLMTVSHDRLPESLIEDLRLALPFTIGKCSDRCESGYTWTEGGTQYRWQPEIDLLAPQEGRNGQ